MYSSQIYVVTSGGVEDTRLEAKAKANYAKKFRGQGQGQTLLRPRTQAQVFSKKKKVFKKFFQAISKKGLQKNFQAKKVFKKFFSDDFDLRKTKKDLRKFSAWFLALSNKISTVQKIVLSSSRGQGIFRGLEASRPRPRTSKCVLGDVLEAKNVLEDSPSGFYLNNNNSKLLPQLRRLFVFLILCLTKYLHKNCFSLNEK